MIFPRRSYSRKQAVKEIKKLLERVEQVNNGHADHEYYNRIKDVILYGEIIENKNAKRIKEINLCVVDENNPEKLKIYRKKNTTLGRYASKYEYIEFFHKVNYITKNKRLFNVSHTHAEINGAKATITGVPHMIIYNNYKPCEDIRERLQRLEEE